MLDGIVEIVESVFSVPVRLGEPREIDGLKDVVRNPAFATGVGLVVYGSRNSHRKQKGSMENGFFSTILNKMKQWFRDVV